MLCALFALDKADRVFSMWFLSSLTLRGVDVSAVKRHDIGFHSSQRRQQCSCGQVEGYMRSFCGSVSFERMVVRSAAQRLESHRAAGHLIILLSASPLPITKPIAEHFVRPQPSPQRNPGRISKDFSGRCRDNNEGRFLKIPAVIVRTGGARRLRQPVRAGRLGRALRPRPGPQRLARRRD